MFLLDEPFANLDLSSSRIVQGLLAELAAKQLVIVTAHYRLPCDRAKYYRIQDGHLVPIEGFEP
jgi:ABC-type transport system involved in cytochrome bd biosynthesis fused ATPase/permease subunit